MLHDRYISSQESHIFNITFTSKSSTQLQYASFSEYFFVILDELKLLRQYKLIELVSY